MKKCRFCNCSLVKHELVSENFLNVTLINLTVFCKNCNVKCVLLPSEVKNGDEICFAK